MKEERRESRKKRRMGKAVASAVEKLVSVRRRERAIGVAVSHRLSDGPSDPKDCTLSGSDECVITVSVSGDIIERDERRVGMESDST